MSYLLDTHTLIWALTDPGKLSRRVKDILENPDERIIVSAVTFWEISLKYKLGKLLLEAVTPQDFPEICRQLDIETAPLDPEICATYHQLGTDHHKDPFDKMLVWVAKSYHYTILSKDEDIRQYTSMGVKVIW